MLALAGCPGWVPPGPCQRSCVLVPTGAGVQQPGREAHAGPDRAGRLPTPRAARAAGPGQRPVRAGGRLVHRAGEARLGGPGCGGEQAPEGPGGTMDPVRLPTRRLAQPSVPGGDLGLNRLVPVWYEKDLFLLQLQAFFLVADDIMDSSLTRRGQPCWYKKVPGAGAGADGTGHRCFQVLPQQFSHLMRPLGSAGLCAIEVLFQSLLAHARCSCFTFLCQFVLSCSCNVCPSPSRARAALGCTILPCCSSLPCSCPPVMFLSTF